MIARTDIFPEGHREASTLRVPECPESEATAVDKAPDPFIKIEGNTLVWSGSLENGGRIIYKMYHHRGVFNFLREKIFSFRAEREYKRLSFIMERGIRCSEPLFWSNGYREDLGFYEILATCKIANAVSLNRFLKSSDAEIKDIDLTPVFQIIRKMHMTGFHHGALYPRNVLIKKSAKGHIEPHIIDTPKSIIFNKDIFGQRMAWFDLMDLCRELILYFEPEMLRPYLLSYGLSGESISEFISRLGSYNTRKKTRKMIRGEFILRAFIQKVFRLKVLFQ